jgi:ATP-dependent DNA ligase
MIIGRACLCVLRIPPTGKLFVHEIKHDGFRIVARRIGKTVTLYTKQGHDWTKRYPLIVERCYGCKTRRSSSMARRWPSTPPANHDFAVLWDRKQDDRAQLCAFDLLELNGRDFRLFRRSPEGRARGSHFRGVDDASFHLPGHRQKPRLRSTERRRNAEGFMVARG